MRRSSSYCAAPCSRREDFLPRQYPVPNTESRKKSRSMERFSRKSSTWEPPIELQRSTPREVSLTAKGKAAVIGMILLIVAAVFGSVFLAAKAKADEQRWTAWQAEAVSTQGEVTGLQKRGSGDDT